MKSSALGYIRNDLGPGMHSYYAADESDFYQFGVGDASVVRKINSSLTRPALLKAIFGDSVVETQQETEGDRQLFYGNYQVEGTSAEFVVTAWTCSDSLSIFAFYTGGLAERLPEAKQRLLATQCPDE